MKNKSQGKMEVAIVVFGFSCDPDEVTNCFGIEPFDIARIGQKLGGPEVRFYDYNAWELQSDLIDEMDLDAHIQHIFQKIGDLSRLDSITKGWEAKLECNIEIRNKDTRPTLWISAESVQRLAASKCSVDIDYQIYPKFLHGCD